MKLHGDDDMFVFVLKLHGDDDHDDHECDDGQSQWQLDLPFSCEDMPIDLFVFETKPTYFSPIATPHICQSSVTTPYLLNANAQIAHGCTQIKMDEH